MMNMFRCSLVVVALILGASPASAGGPVRSAIAIPPGTIIDLGVGPCAFPVALTIVAIQEFDVTFPEDPVNQTQRHLVNGNLVVAFSNEQNGNAVTREVPGPGEYVYSTVPGKELSFHASWWGPWAVFFFPDQRGPGTPGALFINKGHMVVDQDSDGFHQTVLSQVGAQENLCAVLQ